MSINLSKILAYSALFASGITAPNAAAETNGQAPVVVELFTSQSCSSCVAATEYFGALAERDDIVALAWHVDYWNMLHTAKGRWADTHSDPQCTKRQRAYNRNIRGRSSVYTPQMVINGAIEAVGSARDNVDQLIAAERNAANPPHIKTHLADGNVIFEIGESKAQGEAFLVTMKAKARTEVTKGENAGRTFDETNVVTSIRSLGAVTASGARLSAKPPDRGNHCALIIQEPNQGRIIAAAYCAAS